MLIPSRNGAYFVNTVVRFSHQGHRLLIFFYDVALVGWVIVLTYSFLFRCLAVRNRERYVFNRVGILILIVITIFGCFFSPTIAYLAGPAVLSKETAALLEDLSGHNITDLTVVGSQFFVSLL